MPIPKQEPTAEKPALLILHAVAEYERQLGIGSLAVVLKGSKSKRVFDRKLYTSKVFGALFYHPVDVIENFIKQLIQKGFLAKADVGFQYPSPVLVLTSEGRTTLQENKDIPLEMKRTIAPLVLNDSARVTIDLFRQLKSVSVVAQQRQLAESTIWEHLIIAVKLGLLAPTEVVEPEKARLIIETNNHLQPKGLKELKTALPENISYDEIRCVLAGTINGH